MIQKGCRNYNLGNCEIYKEILWITFVFKSEFIGFRGLGFKKI